jgi:hypothetical protein
MAQRNRGRNFSGMELAQKRGTLSVFIDSPVCNDLPRSVTFYHQREFDRVSVRGKLYEVP